MKKSILIAIALLVLGNFVLSSCSMSMFESRAYISGQHASKQGTKAQARASKHAKHFWF